MAELSSIFIAIFCEQAKSKRGDAVQQAGACDPGTDLQPGVLNVD
jgi:hypothetical protein